MLRRHRLACALDRASAAREPCGARRRVKFGIAGPIARRDYELAALPPTLALPRDPRNRRRRARERAQSGVKMNAKTNDELFDVYEDTIDPTQWIIVKEGDSPPVILPESTWRFLGSKPAVPDIIHDVRQRRFFLLRNLAGRFEDVVKLGRPR
jgi:hypothetical protein